MEDLSENSILNREQEEKALQDISNSPTLSPTSLVSPHESKNIKDIYNSPIEEYELDNNLENENN